MYRVTHIYIGFIAGLFIGNGGIEALLNGLIGALGGYVPDIDLKLTHRKTLHNLVIPILTMLALLIPTVSITPTLSLSTGIAKYVVSFTTGWILHVATDSLTVRGVYPLYPVNKKFRLRFAKFRSESILINTFTIMLASMILGYWLYRKGFYENLAEFIELINVFETVKTTVFG